MQYVLREEHWHESEDDISEIMQSILISSKDKNKAKDFISELSQKRKIDKFDINIFEYEKALGIDDVRELQKKIFLKPIKGDYKTVAVNTPDITHEAQNAFLKTLEEPPESTLIILAVNELGSILPTIISRCKVFDLNKGVTEFTKNEISQYLNILISLSGKGVGEKLKLAQDLSKDKEQCLEFLESLILFFRKKLLASHSNDIYYYSGKIKTVQKFHTIIKTTNVNLRLALENLFLNL